MSKTVSGELITIDDSAYDGLDDIVIYGNTVQNLWVNPSGTNNGITTTSNEDGTITLSGTSNSSTSTIQVRSYALKPSTQYTFSVDKEIPGGNTSFILVQYNKSGQTIGSNRVIGKDGLRSVTFTTQSDMSYIYMQVYCNRQDTTVSGTYRVMLNEGSEAQPWCPPGLNGVEELSIVTAGKNILQYLPSLKVATQSGITFTPQDDGGIKVQGTASAAAYYNLDFVTSASSAISDARPFIGTQVTVSIRGGEGVHLSSSIFNDEGAWENLVSTSSNVTATVPDDAASFRSFIAVARGVSVDAVVYPQLELGSVATAYEPPNVITTTIDLQGHTLNALPDGTRDELHIDGGGNVVLEKRTGVATAPTSEGSWSFEREFGRGSFGISPSVYGKAGQGTLLCDKLPPRAVTAPVDSGTYSLADGNRGYARISTVNTISELVPIAGGATYIYLLADPQTIQLGKISLPKLRKKPLVNNVFANGIAETTNFYLDTEIELTYRQWPGVRADGFKVSGKHNFWDFASCVAFSDSGRPEKKFVTATVPYMSGFYDLSKIYGAIAYESRDVSYTFELLGDDMDDLQRQKTNLLDWLGLVHDEPIYDDTQPNYHYVGSFYEADWEEDETGESGTLTVTFKCQPFLIADRATEESLSVGTHTVVNNGQQVSVFAKANSGSATVKINGVIQAVTTTEQRLTAQLQPGENEVVVTSNSVTLRYYERHL